MKTLIREYLKNKSGEFSYFENDDEIILRYCSSRLLISVQLSLRAPDKTQLMRWMRLGEPSLNHFPGALAQAPNSGALWLIHCLPERTDEQHLYNGIEALLNQRDTWRATAARMNERPLEPLPTSLRSLLY
ncbi:type III secretion protein [Pseudomonas rhodesiae]|uniref:type III secretion protein n=1 Tax=Pseudomonas rhodesiae TaxID=76760 RepID=UPI0032B1E82C